MSLALNYLLILFNKFSITIIYVLLIPFIYKSQNKSNNAALYIQNSVWRVYLMALGCIQYCIEIRCYFNCNFRVQRQGRSQGGGCHRCMCTPLFKKKYFLCRIIRFYTNNPKCQYVYLSYYLNDYQIIDKVNTI